MPLDSEHEAPPRPLDRLRQIVEYRDPGHREPLADLGDALMVMGLGVVRELTRRRRRQRVGCQAHLVVGALEASGHAEVLVVAELVGQVLQQRAAEGDIEHLHAAADPEHRHVALDRTAAQRDLELVAFGRRAVGLGIGRGAVGGGIDVGAPDQDQGVDVVQELVGRVDEQRIGRDHQRQAAGPLDRADIAGRQQRRRLSPDAIAGVGDGGADADRRSLFVHLHQPSSSLSAHRRSADRASALGGSRIGARRIAYRRSADRVSACGGSRDRAQAPRSTARWTLPLVVLGSSAANSTIRGYL